MGNEDSIDEEGRKEVYTGHTVEIGVCVKPRLVPSGHLATDVTLPPSLECHVRHGCSTAIRLVNALPIPIALPMPMGIERLPKLNV